MNLLQKVITPNEMTFKTSDLLSEMQAICSNSTTPEKERLLLKILQYSGEINVDSSCDTTHSMSPTNMLKSLAVQYLEKETNDKYLNEFIELLAFSKSPGLTGIINKILKKYARF